MQTYNTIIVGGGMAGLGCARTLVEKGETDFLLVTEDIGGRVVPSADKHVNYGAFYVRSDYEHIQHFVKKTRRIRPNKCAFFHDDRRVPYWHWRSIPHLPSLIRLYFFLRAFKKNYRSVRKRCESISQKQAMEENAFFLKLYKTPARDIVKKLGAEYWAENFINPIVWATAFEDIENANGACIGLVSLPFIVRSYEFIFDIETMEDPVRAMVRQGSAIAITHTGEVWNVQLKNGETISAHHVVLAVPIEIAKTLIAIPEHTNTPVGAYMAHVRGELRKKYDCGEYIFFGPWTKDIHIVAEPDGSYLFYSQHAEYDLSKYFETFDVIATKHWDPGFVLGTNILESERGNGMFLIGGHNAPTMEDAFITGIYAANRILKDHA